MTATLKHRFAPLPTKPIEPFDGRLLSIAADQFDDMERTRVANENRLRQLTRSVEDSDGEQRGFGYDEGDPEVAGFVAVVRGLRTLEHDAELALKRALRLHPLGKWCRHLDRRGVGEKQLARLLATLGDPYVRPEMTYDDHTEAMRRRSVGELWSYAGYGVVDGQAPARQKGQLMTWSPRARMRVYLIAEKCSMQPNGSRYRDIYVAGREKYEHAVHQEQCKRCGPSGKPAPVGSPLSKGHQHKRALRLVSKEILRDLWLEARRLHGEH